MRVFLKTNTSSPLPTGRQAALSEGEGSNPSYYLNGGLIKKNKDKKSFPFGKCFIPNLFREI
jgi:hypothetical protein